jgi:hypothetical protein
VRKDCYGRECIDRDRWSLFDDARVLERLGADLMLRPFSAAAEQTAETLAVAIRAVGTPVR